MSRKCKLTMTALEKGATRIKIEPDGEDSEVPPAQIDVATRDMADLLDGSTPDSGGVVAGVDWSAERRARFDAAAAAHMAAMEGASEAQMAKAHADVAAAQAAAGEPPAGEAAHSAAEAEDDESGDESKAADAGKGADAKANLIDWLGDTDNVGAAAWQADFYKDTPNDAGDYQLKAGYQRVGAPPNPDVIKDTGSTPAGGAAPPSPGLALRTSRGSSATADGGGVKYYVDTSKPANARSGVGAALDDWADNHADDAVKTMDGPAVKPDIHGCDPASQEYKALTDAIRQNGAAQELAAAAEAEAHAHSKAGAGPSKDPKVDARRVIAAKTWYSVVAAEAGRTSASGKPTAADIEARILADLNGANGRAVGPSKMSAADLAKKAKEITTCTAMQNANDYVNAGAHAAAGQAEQDAASQDGSACPDGGPAARAEGAEAAQTPEGNGSARRRRPTAAADQTAANPGGGGHAATKAGVGSVSGGGGASCGAGGGGAVRATQTPVHCAAAGDAEAKKGAPDDHVGAYSAVCEAVAKANPEASANHGGTADRSGVSAQ